MTDVDHHEVATCVLVDRDRVLLCHRHPDRRWYPDVWDLPGGHVDAGESARDAAVRELQEELGVTPHIPDASPFRVLHPKADLTLHVWVVTEWTGEIVNLAPEEHDDLGWFSVTEAAAMSLADDAILDLLCEAVEVTSPASER